MAEEINVGKVFWAVFTIAAVIAVGLMPDAAQARDYPFCIRGADYGSAVGDCSFDTFEQCQATASGRFDSCAANPYYAGPQTPASHPRKRRVHP